MFKLSISYTLLFHRILTPENFKAANSNMTKTVFLPFHVSVNDVTIFDEKEICLAFNKLFLNISHLPAEPTEGPL